MIRRNRVEGEVSNMPTIPPLVIQRSATALPSDGNSWLTFNLAFVSAISVLLNILLVLRLATLR